MADPTSDIRIGTWDEDPELREKADIHRARLNKFGKSRMNGEMLFKSPSGEVYKCTPDGEKTFV